jgi:tetratricopeptide (TPR) repeat protein
VLTRKRQQGDEPETEQALSQFEALSMSACKRKSGDKMSCMSCHDPHQDPADAEKAAYYRGKCLNCHGEAFAAKHHANKPDCRPCHMPALPSQSVAHTESTDHRILRHPHGFQLPKIRVTSRLTVYPESKASEATARDFGLAWETLAQRDLEGASHEAEQYLREAVKESPEDPRLLSAMGFIEQKHGHDKEARELYERVLKIDPLSNDAATNLGTLEARVGNLRRAVALWQGAFARVPHRSEIGMDLAIAFCAAGHKEEARHYVLRVLEFNPDFTNAKRLLGHLNADPAKCKP